MAMAVVYIPYEATVKVSTGLSKQELIETQICNRNPVSWIDQVSGLVRSVVDAQGVMMTESLRPVRLINY